MWCWAGWEAAGEFGLAVFREVEEFCCHWPVWWGDLGCGGA